MTETKKPPPPMNPEIYRQLANRPDFNAERRAATAIFRVLGLGKDMRRQITSYCLDNNIIDNPLGREPQVAVFTLKMFLRHMRPNAAAMRVQDFVLSGADTDWYHTGIYPVWTGAVTALVRSGRPANVVFAVHADDLSCVSPPFHVDHYIGESGEARIFEVQQELHAFVGIVGGFDMVLREFGIYG